MEREYNEALRLNGNSKNYNFSDIQKLEGNPMEGKTLCVLGSSVAYGASSSGDAVGEYFEKRFGCKLVKEAVSGTTLADLDDSSYVSRLLNNVTEEKVDLFICQLSTNDATKNIKLGEISEGKNFSDFDKKTVIGAMEYIIRYAQTTWNCPVAFFTGSYYNSDNYAKMVEALKALSEKWDICVLNLYDDPEFNDLTEEERSIYMSDDIHPKRAGYRDWWGPELERQLLVFMEKNTQ
ncbi:MAG: SGNH/GDSL hydrolase family protein [Lachnospiraceae bacterium]|nr:SGNH/GDSL hydrolase family protein [Lachnospiraceae bacterium]